ncbi:MAG: hypothetical protein GXP29_02580 [Planctomycetes bacterium]|nr:hypothetical protein [Planctomycetota bacterium]
MTDLLPLFSYGRIHLLGCVLVLTTLPCMAANEAGLDAAVEKTATRWSRLSICKVVVDSHPAAARVPLKLQDQMWDPSVWQPLRVGLQRQLTMRFPRNAIMHQCVLYIVGCVTGSS